MIACGKKLDSNITTDELFKVVTEEDILSFYFGIDSIKKGTIKSLLRSDNNPSCALRRTPTGHIRYKDFATGENYSVIELCSMYFFGTKDRFLDTIKKIKKDIYNNLEHKHIVKKNVKQSFIEHKYRIDVVVRKWQQHDIDFWGSFGITIEWLKFAKIYPIKHYIYVFEDGYASIKGTDKHAYAYLEYKGNKMTWKIYQPFNKNGRKWRNNHDSSVISLWNQAINTKSKYICICSSTKDALCLWANFGIPSIAIQSENTNISETAVKVLKQRFTNIYILLDNDKAGKRDAKILSEKTGFTNLELPDLGAKDISDLYKQLNNRKLFVNIISNLFKNKQNYA